LPWRDHFKPVWLDLFRRKLGRGLITTHTHCTIDTPYETMIFNSDVNIMPSLKTDEE